MLFHALQTPCYASVYGPWVTFSTVFSETFNLRSPSLELVNIWNRGWNVRLFSESSVATLECEIFQWGFEEEPGHTEPRVHCDPRSEPVEERDRKSACLLEACRAKMLLKPVRHLDQAGSFAAFLLLHMHIYSFLKIDKSCVFLWLISGLSFLVLSRIMCNNWNKRPPSWWEWPEHSGCLG